MTKFRYIGKRQGRFYGVDVFPDEEYDFYKRMEYFARKSSDFVEIGDSEKKFSEKPRAKPKPKKGDNK